MNLFYQEDNGALFSDCRKYRFVLWRIWDKNKPIVMFIGLNPSTANENTNDPTIKRVMRFASDWGYGGIYMLNLFTYVTACPEELHKAEDPVFMSDWYLEIYAQKVNKIIFAWGSFQEAVERAKQMKIRFERNIT
ncbi:hypothetical protein ES708_32699 [subsurface metagenome]